MNRLKTSLTSVSTTFSRLNASRPRIPAAEPYSSSSPTKLIKRNPFEIGAGPADVDMEESTLNMATKILLAAEVFFAFLSMCCLASLAAFQNKWKIGTSGLVAWSLFLTIFLMLLSFTLLIPPILFDKYDKLGGMARFLKERRSQWVLQGAGVAASLIGAVQLTGSAFSQKGCKNPDDDPHESLGDDFKAGLKGWCTTKKASSVFMWLEFGTWIAALFMYLITSYRQSRSSSRSQYHAPSNDVYGASTEIPARFVSTIGTAVYEPTRLSTGEEKRDRKREREREIHVEEDEVEGDVGYLPLRYEQPHKVQVQASVPRGSQVPLGRPESTKPLSRTMQLAKEVAKQYADPYAGVTASLNGTSPSPAPQASAYGYGAQRTSYDAGGGYQQPHTGYAGYR